MSTATECNELYMCLHRAVVFWCVRRRLSSTTLIVTSKSLNWKWQLTLCLLSVVFLFVPIHSFHHIAFSSLPLSTLLFILSIPPTLSVMPALLITTKSLLLWNMYVAQAAGEEGGRPDTLQYTHSHGHTHTHTQSQGHTHMRTHIHTQSQGHACTCTHTHKHHLNHFKPSLGSCPIGTDGASRFYLDFY